MVYQIYFVGGPQDGTMTFAIRPYYELTMNGHFYKAEKDPPDHEVWVDDNTRDITLLYQESV